MGLLKSLLINVCMSAALFSSYQFDYYLSNNQFEKALDIYITDLNTENKHKDTKTNTYLSSQQVEFGLVSPLPCLISYCFFPRTVIRSICSSGIDNNPTVFYRLMPGSTAQTNKFHTFYLQQRTDNGFTWADIKVNHPLDYETIKEYNLTIRVEVSNMVESLFT